MSSSRPSLSGMRSTRMSRALARALVASLTLSNDTSTPPGFALRKGRLRNGVLARKLEGITPKMPTQTLRVLARDGLVWREIFPVIPPRVEYELTELGQNLAALLTQIRSWAEQHAPDIKDARARATAGNEGDWAA